MKTQGRIIEDWIGGRTPSITNFSAALVLACSLTVGSNAFGLTDGDRVQAAAGGANVRNLTSTSPVTFSDPLFTQVGGVHGTIKGTAVSGTAGGYTGNWWKIAWDSEPPNLNQQVGWSAESVISTAPVAGDVPQPTFLSTYYTSNNIFWQSGFAPTLTSPPNPQLGTALGNCTWYASGRMLELGFNATQVNALHGNASQWASEALGIKLQVDTTPALHCIAQVQSRTGFTLGHVAIVESLNADGTITVTESSYVLDATSPWDVLWRHRTVLPTWFDNFIHLPSVGQPPTVTTEAASAVTSTTATIFGHVNPNGLATTYYFQWGLTTAYGNTIPNPPFSVPAGQSTSSGAGAPLTGLTPNTTYHYQLVASNSAGPASGVDLTFTTQPFVGQPPTVTTEAASAVTSTTATIFGHVNPNGLATTYYFQWGLTTAYGNTIPNPPFSVPAGQSTSSGAGAPLTGLTPNTTYHYRLVASNSAGPASGADLTFVTVPIPPLSISGGGLSAGTFTVPVSTVPGVSYSLEFKNSLSDLSWSTAQTVNGTGGAITLMDQTGSSNARFYRIRIH